MIAACPKCSTRYRIDGARVGAAGAKLRCSRCQAIFRVNPPPAVRDTVEPARAVAEAPAAAPATAGDSTSAREGIRAPGDGDGPTPDSSLLVLVADPDPEFAKATANALSSWGLRPILAHDGVEAIMTIQRTLPRVVILDAALPKMFGFQVCELMKRNQSLREIAVILIGAIHHRARYRRPPTELYGADAYIERPDLPDGLRPILEGLGLPLAARSSVQPAEPSRAPVESSPPESGLESTQSRASATAGADAAPRPPMGSTDESPTNEFEVPSFEPPEGPQADASPAMEAPVSPRSPVAQASAPKSDGAGEEREQAERLARIIVSDIVLYNQEKFEAAVEAGNVVEVMQAEMDEARGLFTQRVAAAIRDERDFLTEELLRVARARGMK